MKLRKPLCALLCCLLLLGLAPGSKSAAFRLTLRSDEGSITAAQADGEIKAILEALEKELEAVLR